MKNILVPTDFSPQALYAFDLAVEICRKTGAKLNLMHVADLPVASDPMGTNLHSFFSPEILSQLEDGVQSKFKELAQRAADVAMEYKLEWGNPFAGISNYITANDVDFVVMGTKGARGMKELIIGSNAEKVVRNAHCPVLSIKSPIHLTDLKNIVFGNDLSFDQEKLVNKIKYLQGILEAKIHIVRINTPGRFKRDFEIKKELELFSRHYQFENFTLNIFNDFHEDQGLIYFAEQIGADLIALGTHGKRGFGHLISGSIAEDIVNHAKRPIWTYVPQ